MTDDLDKAKRVAGSWHLGQTSAGYESGAAGPGAVSTGKGDHGGVSYGSFQLSTKMGTLQEYLDQSAYKDQFKGLTPATPAFDEKWKALGKNDPGFGADQKDFIGRSHYNEQDKALKAAGIDLSGRGMAVQDAVWSTSVQTRDLTPKIFAKGLKEKFGDDYQLDKLSDKDIVDAVQDYKAAHVKDIWASSPQLHKGLSKRIAHEKESLDVLADADRVLKENGVTVEHKGKAASAADHPSQASGDHVQRAGTLRLHDHSPDVAALQAMLNKHGNLGNDGKSLTPDGDFGTNTQGALKRFQTEAGLTADGIAGPKTMEALKAATREQPMESLKDKDHPGHALYEQALAQVHQLDAKLGRTPDAISENVAGAAAQKAQAEGLTRIDHLVMANDGSTAYTVQGDLNSPLKKVSGVDMNTAIGQTPEQSASLWNLEANNQKLAAQERHQQQAQAPAAAQQAAAPQQ